MSSATTPALPNWTDPQAVLTYLTSLVATGVAVVTAVHPGFHEPPVVEALLPAVSLTIGGLAQLVNVVTHRSAHAKVAAAAISTAGAATAQAIVGPAVLSGAPASPAALGAAASALSAAASAVSAAAGTTTG